ncbi:hypothetical protein B484DRAFT_282790 [Ochromonadaceae sp. CCMP2298]|nr:hypothetical protein B484DRAFT_282790 [Ochromonadaceae sp. CCMP2298]
MTAIRLSALRLCTGRVKFSGLGVFLCRLHQQSVRHVQHLAQHLCDVRLRHGATLLAPLAPHGPVPAGEDGEGAGLAQLRAPQHAHLPAAASVPEEERLSPEGGPQPAHQRLLHGVLCALGLAERQEGAGRMKDEARRRQEGGGGRDRKSGVGGETGDREWVRGWIIGL